MSHSPAFSFETRRDALSHIQSSYDAVIIGGGIVGVGAAREMALRGLKTLLVEQNDFASGTSSKSSKLIHGGLRYLEMFDFGLVFEALSERHWLLKTHPHLVEPLEFVLPIYDSKSAPRGARKSGLLGLGLWLYDALSLFRSPFFHGRFSKNEMETRFPHLRNKGLAGGYYYADAMMLDDELVLECAYDAHKRGATLLNYVSAQSVTKDTKESAAPFTVTLRDELTGNLHTVHSKEVVTCVGPWTEKIGPRIAGGSVKKLKPSKGVHLIFPYEKLPTKGCLVMYAPDGRILFIIPRHDFGKGAEIVIVGTTDSAEENDPGKVSTNAADIDYLFRVLKEYFPDTNLSQKDILASYAGVRPLIDDGAESEAKVSREHEIWKNSEGVVFMAGGKYTTFRPISQEIVDFAFPDTKGISIQGVSINEISQEPLSSPEEYAKRFSGAKLWGKYTEGWIRWKLSHHSACTFEDVVFRRLPIWMAGTQIPESTLRRIHTICKEHFRWSESEAKVQWNAVQNKLKINLLPLFK